MIPKPIDATTHVLDDYAFAAVQIAAPSILGLKGAARRLAYFFGGTVAVVNGLTDNRFGVKRVIPFKVHGAIETPFVPALLALPLVCGAMKERRARWFFLSYFVVAAAHYLLTDYGSGETSDRPEESSPKAQRDPGRSARATISSDAHPGEEHSDGVAAGVLVERGRSSRRLPA